MKLWQGRFEEESDPVFEKMNRSLGIDAVLLEVDIRASRAHARSLLGCGVLTQQEWTAIDQGLEQILSEYSPEQVKSSPYEDIHTFVEATLTSKIGPVAGKLHTGRSRNDQVATDFRLFVRKAIGLILADLEALQLALIESGAGYSDVIIPAYTHLRRAQPVRWSHYCLAYVEMFRRDAERFEQSLSRSIFFHSALELSQVPIFLSIEKPWQRSWASAKFRPIVSMRRATAILYSSSCRMPRSF